MSSSFSSMTTLSAVSSQLSAGTDSRELLESGEEKGERAARAGHSVLGRGAGRLFLVAFAEAFDAAGRVDQLLFAREEGVTLAADFQRELFLGGVGRPGHAAGAVDQNFVILGVQVLFHGTAHSKAAKRVAQPPQDGGRGRAGGKVLSGKNLRVDGRRERVRIRAGLPRFILNCTPRVSPP